MKKWLRRIGFVFAVVVGALFVLAAWSQTDSTMLKGYKSNEALRTIKPDWPGTPVDQKDRFMNHEFPYLPKMTDLLKWKLSGNGFSDAKKNDSQRLEVRDPHPFLASDKDGILWLGHASFYIRVNGVGILTDPVFDDPAFLTRFVPVASPLADLNRVDYVLLSHDHRDHMDESTLRSVASKFPNAKFLAGLRSDDVLREWTTPTNRIDTAGWFQEFGLNDDRLRIYLLPLRHWSRRGLFDMNFRLWGGYLIQTPSKTIYFGGDSGYGRHYSEMRELFPNIDYFLIGIGAYEPRWFMEPNHNNPSDAIKSFIDSGARHLIPMHYGTFDLSDEPPSQPLQLLKDEAEKSGISEKLKPLAIYESLTF